MAENRGPPGRATPDLRSLQIAFQDYLTRGGPGVLDLVISDDTATAATRLNVYADAYRLRLLEALGIDYPGLHGLLGDEQFERLGRAYIDANPSTHPSLRWFGAGMESFTGRTPPYSGEPLIAELVRFEWAQAQVFDAADAEAIQMSLLEAMTPRQWPSLGGRVHPSVLLLDLHWNVPPVWQALDAGEAPPPPSADAVPQTWLMWRRQLETHWRSLAVDEAWALQAFADGTGFGDICEGLVEWIDVEHIAVRAAGFLKQWIHDSLVAELTSSSPP